MTEEQKIKARDRIRKWASRPENKAKKYAYYIANRDRISAYKKARYAKIKADPIKWRRFLDQCSKNSKNTDKTKLLATARRWRSKPSAKEWWRAYEKRRRYTDPQFALRKLLGNRMRVALRGRTSKVSTMEALGCSVAELKAHLESLFLPGMTWENRGAWHIDHIRPCASFDLLDPEQQRCCFHYSNLQPLWKSDNLRKGTKIGVI